MNRKINDLKKLIIGFFLLLVALFSILPFIYMILVSFSQKDNLDLYFNFTEFSFENYVVVFKNFNLLMYFKNSVIVTAFSCLFNCLICSMAAYIFAKKNFKYKNAIFGIYLATLMLPSQVKLIPSFILIKNLGLMNTHLALILPIINAFGVFLIKQFMVNVPNELLEAAKIDGCGENRIFANIVLPLIKPVLISLVIFTFITSWNDFLWPLVIASKENTKTLTLAIASLKGLYSVNYGLVMAGSTITFLPPFILYIFLQKQFMEGIALSGIKG